MHFTMTKENDHYDCGLDLRTDKMNVTHPMDSDPHERYPEYCRTLKVKDNNGMVKELVFPRALDLDRPKRARTTFSAEQLYHLEQDFLRNQYLVGRERTELAHRLNLSETQVKVWFQNRRTKYKRDKVREAEDKKQNAESLAACNILRLLQGTPAGSSKSSETPTSYTSIRSDPPAPPMTPMTSINSTLPMPTLPFLHLPFFTQQPDLSMSYKP